MGDDAAPVEQHQRVADPQRAEIDRPDVAARRIARLRIVAGVEADVAHLRNAADQFVAADHAGGVDPVLIKDHHRQRLGDARPLDPRADDDDVGAAAALAPAIGRVVLHGGGIVLRPGGSTGEQADRRARKQQCRCRTPHYPSPSAFNPCPVRRVARPAETARRRPAPVAADRDRAHCPSGRRRPSRPRCR